MKHVMPLEKKWGRVKGERENKRKRREEAACLPEAHVGKDQKRLDGRTLLIGSVLAPGLRQQPRTVSRHAGTANP